MGIEDNACVTGEDMPQATRNLVLQLAG